MTTISNRLITEFVKITNDSKNNKKTESTVYGTIVLYEGKKHVKIDGSDLLTPISTTTAIDEGERVIVTIKNHTATVTGNLSEPAAKDSVVEEIGNKISDFEIVIADKVSTKDFDAEVGRIDALVSDNVLIKETLTAHEGRFETIETDNITINETLIAQKAVIDELDATKIDASIVEAEFVEITGKLEATTGEFNALKSNYATFESTVTSKLEAQDATIKDLEANTLTAEEADIKYAQIDFANIGDAAVENLFAKSGLIEDLVVGDGTITGNLVGVTIKGDLIEGGTVVADKLVVKGEDGLYYKLNTDGETVETSQTDYNSLNGSVITAKSITATKISVDDLVAFDATIGGFNITEDSLYSGVKESMSNITTGVYLDRYGQINIGGLDNFIKYYKVINEDGTEEYRLEISADTIKISSSDVSVDELLNEANQKLEQSSLLESRIDGISASVTEMKTIQNATDETLGVLTSDIISLTNSVESKMSATDVQLAIQNGLANGVTDVTTTTGFTFNQEGLTISRSDKDASTNIDEEGMVIRNTKENVDRLIANSDGVIAYNLEAKNYFIMGDNSRFEDYMKDNKPQTGCFWIGETEVE